MATVRKEFNVAVSAERAWGAVRDFGALHEQLVPGFVTAAHVEGNDRVVTFFSGTVLRERLVTLDDEKRRLMEQGSKVIKQTLERAQTDAT